MKKKALFIILVLLIALSFVVAGCSESASESEANTEVDPEESTSADSDEEPFEIQIVSLAVGYDVYNSGVGLAEIINKKSTWLKAVSLEGKNPTVSTKTLIAEPEKKKNTVFFMDSFTPWAGEQKIGGYADVDYDYSKFRGLFALGCGPNVLVVIDPNIKTLQDLKGKRVVITSTPGCEIDVIYKGIFEEAGVLNDINLEYMSQAPSAEALRDGKLDAIMISVSLIDPDTDEWLLSSAGVELTSLVEAHPLSVPAEYIEGFAQKSGCPVSHVDLPPGTIGPHQTEPFTAVNKHVLWGVHVDMPDRVVKEILRIASENTEEFKKYSSRVMTPEIMGTMALPEERLHPAAVEFYKEHNIPITSF